MFSYNTIGTLHQTGVLRIEIAAIVMLLTALAIVLVTNIPPAHLSGVAQAGEPLEVVPAGATVTGIAIAPRLQIEPEAGSAPDSL